MIRAFSHLYTPGSNYMSDPGAEASPRNTLFWYTNGSAVIAFDTAEKHSGNQSMKVTTGNTAANNGIVFRYQRLFGWGTIHTGVWVKGPAGVKLNLNALRCWATCVNWSTGGTVAKVCTGGWDLMEIPGNFLPVTNPQVICLRVIINEPTVGVTIWVDDVSIAQFS